MIKKVMFGVLVILIIGVIFYSFKKDAVAPQPAVTSTQSSADKQTISETVDSFYKKYESCMKNPPAEAEGQVGDYCQNNSGLTTVNFAANLEKGGVAQAGANPVVCSQSPPESVTVNPDVQINGDQAKASVIEKFGPTQVTPQLELLKEGGVWKIDNIICPIPK